MRKTETKSFPFVLQKMDSAAGTFSGYASIWDIVDSQGDIVLRGAFKRTLKNKKQFPILWSHSILEPVGVIAGQEDERGLYVEGRLTLDVQRARELRALMLDGAVNGLSVGYQTVKDEFDKESNIRRLREINLWEVSLCVFQACPGAVVDEVKFEAPAELKPYPNEHACRLRDPDEFEADSFRRITREHNGKAYAVILGKLKGEDTMTEQAYRYGKDAWAAEEARDHCREHGGSFEEAVEKCAQCRLLLDRPTLPSKDSGQPTPAPGDSCDTSNSERALRLLDKLKF